MPSFGQEGGGDNGNGEFDDDGDNEPTNSVPVPATVGLIGLGLAGLVVSRNRSIRKR